MKQFAWMVGTCVLVAACSGSDGEAGADGTKGADGVGATGDQGPPGERGPVGDQGPAGAQGPPGADASSHVYGDGSAGPLTIAADTSWYSTPPVNGNFTDLTISAGSTLSVESGTIIRCSGTFKNEGTIQVMIGAFGGQIAKENDSFVFSPATLGNARGLPSMGAVAPMGTAVVGGRGGLGLISPVRASQRLDLGLYGGSGAAFGGGVSGYGGGAVVIRAKAGIVNAAGAKILAGATIGGGGGGIVVLASKTSVTQAGTIEVPGGRGNDGGGYMAPGGGGGGGFVHMLAPVITATGASNVDGGPGGTRSTAVADAVRVGGGGGGGSFGNGGNGASLGTNNMVSTAAGNGTVGAVIESKVDPTALF